MALTVKVTAGFLLGGLWGLVLPVGLGLAAMASGDPSGGSAAPLLCMVTVPAGAMSGAFAGVVEHFLGGGRG